MIRNWNPPALEHKCDDSVNLDETWIDNPAAASSCCMMEQMDLSEPAMHKMCHTYVSSDNKQVCEPTHVFILK